MICPKCKANNSAEERFCIKCGCRLVPIVEEKPKDKETEPWFKIKNKKIAAIGVGIIALIIVVLILIIVIEFSKSESEEMALFLSKGIGHDVSDVMKLDSVRLEEKSTYSGVTDYIKFDYIAESDKSVTADGVILPEWLICVMTEKDKVSSVILYDFTVMKDTYKGEKTDGEIKLSSFSSGDSFSKIKNAVNVSPYSIEYKSDQTVYTYKYYYTDTAGNDQARALTVNVSDNDYISSQTKTVYPAGL